MYYLHKPQHLQNEYTLDHKFKKNAYIRNMGESNTDTQQTTFWIVDSALVNMSEVVVNVKRKTPVFKL